MFWDALPFCVYGDLRTIASLLPFFHVTVTRLLQFFLPLPSRLNGKMNKNYCVTLIPVIKQKSLTLNMGISFLTCFVLNLVNVTILYRKRQIWNKLVTFFNVKGWWGFAFAFFSVIYLSTTWHWLTSSSVYEMYCYSPTGLKITFVLAKLVK